MQRLIQMVEAILWHSRLMILAGVFASLLAGLGVIWLASVDVFYLLAATVSYANPALDTAARDGLRLSVVGDVVGILDNYLLAAMMIVFALGLYELFVGNLAVLERSAMAAKLLRVRSVDDLKDKLGRVVVLVLVVKFAQLALQLKYQSPLDLLMLAAGIVLVGGGLYLSTRHGAAKSAAEPVRLDGMADPARRAAHRAALAEDADYARIRQ
jgi:uncharacterized membrane protein YqhA